MEAQIQSYMVRGLRERSRLILLNLAAYKHGSIVRRDNIIHPAMFKIMKFYQRVRRFPLDVPCVEDKYLYLF